MGKTVLLCECHAISRSKRAEDSNRDEYISVDICMEMILDISVIYFRILVPFISRVRDRNIFGYYYYPVSHTQYCLCCTASITTYRFLVKLGYIVKRGKLKINCIVDPFWSSCSHTSELTILSFLLSYTSRCKNVLLRIPVMQYAQIASIGSYASS